MSTKPEYASHLQTLVGMGFSEKQATRALEQSSGNIDYAANFLTNEMSTDEPKDDSTSTTILAALSQYDLPEGRSACTCMALTVAETLLNDAPMTSETLTSSLCRGHELYLKHRQQHIDSPEHTSAEELLYLFPQIQLAESGIRQGLLTHHGSCWTDLVATTDNKPTAFCIIKPPETILIYKDSNENYWLVDSHSRPPRYTQAYAQKHASFDSLLASLQSLFPATASIPGVSSEMMAMYNSVDVYPLHTKQPSNVNEQPAI